MMKKLFLLFLCCISFVSVLKAQQAENFVFHLDKIQVKQKYTLDSLHTTTQLKAKIVQEFRLEGFVGIRLVDSVYRKETHHFYYEADKQFKKVDLVNIDQPKKVKRNGSFEKTQGEILKKLSQLENNGFPFASVLFLEQEEKDDVLSLQYKIDSGNFYSIDKIIVKSDDKIHLKTLLNVIGLKEGAPYDHAKIKAIPDVLSASKMFGLVQNIQLVYRENSAELYLFLKKLNASSADGYVGFQQDQITNKLVLNGYLNLELKNAFNRAELLDLHWKSNPDKTQNFHGQFSYPYFFNTPLGAGARLEIRKQDSTFLRTDITLNLSYTHPFAQIRLFNQIESSSTLRETAPVEFRNYNKNTIGASIQLRPPKLDFASWYHPSLFLTGGFFNYRDDTIADNKQSISNQKYAIEYAHKLDFLKFFHLNNSLRFEGLSSSINLSRNELVYFGGLNSLRGFYELELSGNNVWSLRNEFEFKPVELFSIFLLYDYGNFKSNGAHYTNSTGLGFAFQAANTSLQIIVANGVQDNNPLDFTNTKIHLGFKSVF